MRRYELLDRVGIGGMAEVFRARVVSDPGDLLGGIPVVVKRILPHLAQDPEYLAMFGDEARIAAALDHPNVVRLLDLGRMDGQLFMALEYVDGADLARVLYQARDRGETLPVSAAFHVLREVLEGLHHAHTRWFDGRALEIVHRDVAPANVLVSRAGAVKVTDFGVAKAVVRSGQTTAGVVKGNTRYMSPEQISGGPVDPRTDVYACGLLLWTLLVGVNPFDGDPLPRVLDRTLTGDIPPPTTANRALPSSVDALVSRAIAFSPADRYPDAQAFRLELDRIARVEGIAEGRNDLATAVVKLLSGVQRGATSSREVSRRSIVARLGPLISGELAEVSVEETPVTPVVASADPIPKEPPRAGVTRDTERQPYRPQTESRLLGHTDAVSAIAFTPGGSLVSVSFDRTLRVWDLQTGAEQFALAGHEAAITSLGVNGDIAITGARDKTVRVWDLAAREEVISLQGHSDWVFAVALSDDARWALSGGFDRTVRLWNLEKERPARVLRGHTDSVSSVLFHPNGVQAISASYDRTIAVWELERGISVRVIGGPMESLRCAAISADGSRFLSAGADGVLRMWDLESGAEVAKMSGHLEPVVALALSPDGRVAATGSYDGTVRLWALDAPGDSHRIRAHQDPVLAVAFSPDGRTVASASVDRTIALWPFR